jgi:hypothetical protein
MASVILTLLSVGVLVASVVSGRATLSVGISFLLAGSMVCSLLRRAFYDGPITQGQLVFEVAVIGALFAMGVYFTVAFA